MSETDYCTPLFDKDKEYAECEKCSGDGWVFTNYEETHCKECTECEGLGMIEIEN